MKGCVCQHQDGIVNTQEIYMENLPKKRSNKPIRRDSFDNLYDNNDLNRRK